MAAHVAGRKDSAAMVVALDGERLGLTGDGCYEVFKQCLICTLEASLASVC